MPMPHHPKGVVSGSGGVRAVNGSVIFSTSVGLGTSGFNIPFAMSLAFDNLGSSAAPFGSNWLIQGALGGLMIDGDVVYYRQGPNNTKVFVKNNSSGQYEALYFVLDTLVFGGGEYRLATPGGQLKYFDSSGKLTAFKDAAGNTAVVGYDSGTGKLASVSVAGPDSSSWDFA